MLPSKDVRIQAEDDAGTRVIRPGPFHYVFWNRYHWLHAGSERTVSFSLPSFRVNLWPVEHSNLVPAAFLSLYRRQSISHTILYWSPPADSVALTHISVPIIYFPGWSCLPTTIRQLRISSHSSLAAPRNNQTLSLKYWAAEFLYLECSCRRSRTRASEAGAAYFTELDSVKFSNVLREHSTEPDQHH